MSPVSIVNKTKNKMLHEDPEWAISLWRQAIGLMFRKPTNQGLIMLFMPARDVSLHMLFVFGPIDVIALDGQGQVVAIKQKFMPWRFWRPGVKASAVLELPVGIIGATGTAIGDIIQLPQPPI